MPPRPVIHWFRQDLRLADNPALTAAASGDRPVVPLYVLDDAAAGDWAPGGASRWWLAGSLDALGRALDKAGCRLVLRRGRTVDTLTQIAAETGAEAIHFTRAYEPWAAQLEIDLKAACDKAGLGLHRHAGALLQEPEALRTKAGEPFRVFTPFWRTLQEQGPARSHLLAPARITPPAKPPKSDKLETWGLLPTRPDWAGGLRETWTPGEAGARERLSDFVDGAMARYADARDRPHQPATSMLSPHLHFGEVSPVQCWQAAREATAEDRGGKRGAESFLREVAWREFSYHLLHHWPDLPEKPFRADFASFPWDTDTRRRKARLRAWQRGETGYPIVDAGIRQLWQTGWMHNRVRLITASFLTKHLLVPWQEGERWFWDTLVDADLANNSASWQWVAGSGADAAPYFRIFNPVLQGEKFDPDGDYVRHFVPELAKLPASLIHAPWKVPVAELSRHGVRLGSDYPKPIVDHAEARATALAAFATLRPGTAVPSEP